jgi:hypothetical protein
MGMGITLCLTAGGRPDLLTYTLSSLLPSNGQFFDAILISNDVGDAETSAVARELAPEATILHHDVPLGHHRTVDELYSMVTTPYVFHCEDDWFFDPVPFIPGTLATLQADTNASVVAVRQSGCLWQWRHAILPSPEARGAHIEWVGYGFSPAMLRLDIWKKFGPFARFQNERELDLAVTAGGYRINDMLPGVCYHIGGGRHINDPTRKRPPRIVRQWRKFKSFVRDVVHG